MSCLRPVHAIDITAVILNETLCYWMPSISKKLTYHSSYLLSKDSSTFGFVLHIGLVNAFATMLEANA